MIVTSDPDIPTVRRMVNSAIARADDLRVMCFNIRYDNPEDGADSWPHRRDMLMRTVEAQ